MGRPKKVVEDLIAKTRNEKVAPKDCPKRNKCRMYAWWCKEYCEDYLGCVVWRKENNG